MRGAVETSSYTTLALATRAGVSVAIGLMIHKLAAPLPARQITVSPEAHVTEVFYHTGMAL